MTEKYDVLLWNVVGFVVETVWSCVGFVDWRWEFAIKCGEFCSRKIVNRKERTIKKLIRNSNLIEKRMEIDNPVWGVIESD